MLKRCLLAVIVALLVTSSQIAAAEDYDWSQAKRIGTKAELARYIENERCNGNTKIRVIFTGERITGDELGYLVPCLDVKGNCYYMYDRTTRINCEIVEYPGTHVANAYRSGDISKLNVEEKKLYRLAVKIVAKANKRSSEKEKAEYIHKVICDSVHGKNKNKRNETAIGALIDHYANCEGFTDAFYMLGRMAGLNVGRIGGYINGNEGHAWNWITFADGKTYCVDVTLDNRYNTHEWFLATFEVMKRHHSCEWEIIPNLQ